MFGGESKGKGFTQTSKEAWSGTRKVLNRDNGRKAMDKSKDIAKGTGSGLKDIYNDSIFGKERRQDLGEKSKGLGSKIKSGTGSLLNKGKGAYGKFADKFGDGSKNGILSQSPNAGGSGIGKLGKLAGGLGKGAGVLGVATSALSLIPALASGDDKAIGKGVGSMGGGMAGASAGASIGALFGGVGAIPGALIGGTIGSVGGGAVGEKVGDMAKKAGTKEGWNLGWSNGDKDGKNKFQDSLIGKPLSKAWSGITGLFDNDAEASEEDSKDKKKGVKGVKGDTKKKEKMTAEQLREKNNQSETKNLKIYSDLLDRAQKIIESAKGISLDGNTEEGGDLGGSDSDEKKPADKWKDDIRKAAKAMGVNITDKDVDGIASLIHNESGGDPGITQGNIGDINNRLGTPAKGLLQYVPSTFDSYKVKGHDNITSGYDQLLAFFNNKNWKQDYNPNGGWSPTGGRVKGGSGGGGGGGEALSSTYQEAMSKPILTSSGSNYRGSNDASNASTTNRVTVNVNVQGGNNPEETGDIIGGRIREVLDSNMDIFANEHKRSY